MADAPAFENTDALKRAATFGRRPRVRVRSRWPPLGFSAFALLIVVAMADFSQDYAYFLGVAYRDLTPGLYPIVHSVQSALIAVGIACGIWKIVLGRVTIRLNQSAIMFLVLFTIATVLGIIVGLSRGVEPHWVFGDAQNIVVYLIALGIRGRYVTTRRLEVVGGLAFVALMIKVALAVISGVALTGILEWRYYLKASSFFPVGAIVGFALLTHVQRRSHHVALLAFAVASLGGVFLAQARSIFIGLFAGMLTLGIFSVAQRRVTKTMFAVAVFSIGIGLGIAAWRGDLSTAFGRWTTEDMSAGAEYRVRQMGALMGMIREYPVLGAGLGAFDPRYEGHEEWLPRPYLMELEYVNLLAKCGIVGCLLLAAAFGFLMLSCARRALRAPVREDRAFLAGLASGLIALLVESISQTLYSSVLFHLYVVFILLAISASRTRKLGPQTAT